MSHELLTVGSSVSQDTVFARFLIAVNTNVLEIGGWGNSGGISVSGNADLSAASVGTVYALTTGNYVGTGASLNLASNTTFNVYANNINTGSVAGGSTFSFNATNTITVDGNIYQPGATVQLLGAAFDNTPGVTVNAGTLILNPSSASTPITILGSGGTANGFTIPDSFLSGVSANVLEIGGWGNSGGISVSGNADLSAASVGTVYALTTGTYSGVNSTIHLAANTNYWSYATTATTGNVAGGSVAAFVCTGELDVDGSVQSQSVILQGTPVIFDPVSMVQVSTPTSRISQDCALNLNVCNLWLGAGTSWDQQGSVIVLDIGEAIVEARKRIRIQTPSGSILLAQGAVALIVCDGTAVHVMALHDNHHASVSTFVAGRNIPLSIGQELCIARKRQALIDEMRGDQIARRSVAWSKVGEYNIAESEYSLPSLCFGSKIARNLLSGHWKQSKLAGQILRSAAALDMLTQQRGPFKRLSALPDSGS
jgi:hypothetical protein